MPTAERTRLRDLISARGHALFDGAMGTMLQDSGLGAGEAAELWNVERPEAVAAIHRGYAAAGAAVLTTNTFGGTRPRLDAAGLGDRVAELNAAGARVARAVADEFGVLVAGDVGPTGELIEPLGTLSPEAARAAFAEQVEALAAGGIDLILAETLSDLAEAEAAVLGARDAAPELEIVVTLSFDTNRHTMMGVSPARAVEEMGRLGVTAVGANCGRGLEDVEAVMAEMAAHRPAGLLLVAQSNAGMPVIRGDAFHYEVTPEQMAAYATRLREMDVELVGACCGSTPAHLAAMATALRA
jgi:5-methyltetrahydrofolate--homocysteine methyltransferase